MKKETKGEVSAGPTFKIGQRARVKDNITTELSRLGFTNPAVLNHLIGTEQEVCDIWTDQSNGQIYITVALCQEVPAQCLELISDGSAG